ncbi:MAG: site-specific DNA-methyltransferase [Phycisphaerales bacterium]|nr:site-specific DNA-methyltransferase [Phycisphaerales bacterium]
MPRLPATWRNRLIQGDCLKVMPRIPDASIDMILCDLPYGTTQNPWDSVIPLRALWEQYQRIIKPRGVIALTAQGLFTAKIIMSNEAWFRYKLAWIKSKPTNFLNARRQPLRQHEDVCIFYKQQPAYYPVMAMENAYDKGLRKDQYTGSYGDFKPVQVKSDGSRFPTDAIYCKTAESEGEVWHPTQKPVALGRFLIRLFTKPGEVVLDNAFGSGSFLVAAAMEQRGYVGIELNQEQRQFKREDVDFITIARERIRLARSGKTKDQPSLFDDLYPGIRNGYRRQLTSVEPVMESK